MLQKILAKINLAVDFLMLAAFIVASFSAIVSDKILPRGGGHVNLFWGVNRSEWLTTHDKSGYLLIVLILIHLGLHWRWFVEYYKKIKNWVISIRSIKDKSV